jgi:hypothetical protein
MAEQHRLEQLGEELERAACIFTARKLERDSLRIREGGNLKNPEVAEARRILRATALAFAAESACAAVTERIEE